MAVRAGLTVPLPGALHTHGPTLARLADAGFSDAWSGEADVFDAFTPLALAATWEPRLRVGTAVVPAYTRGPPTIAQSAAALADAAPGRFLLGLGASSKTIVENWNAVPYDRPLKRVRDLVRFLRDALNGERIAQSYDTFTVNGFRLQRPPETVPPLLIAALGPGMVDLAATDGDGVILNWLGPDDVHRVVDRMMSRGCDPPEVVARLFVVPNENRSEVREIASRYVTAYLNVPSYAAAQRWHGRGDALQPMWDAWSRGDRRAALKLIPDSVIDDLFIHGSPAQQRAAIQRYVDSGVTATSLSILGVPDLAHAEKALLAIAPMG